MYGERQSEVRFDAFGLEVPFAERLEAETPYAEAVLNFGEEAFVTPPSAAFEPLSEGLSWLESAVQEAEGQAAEASEAEWLETEWLDETAGAGETVEAFAERLGRAWSQRRKGDPSPEAMRAWLLKDHEDTLVGARLRWRKRAPADFWPRVSRAWMVSREEQMRFQTERAAGVGPLGGFTPPTERVELIRHPLVGGSDKAPVAPLTGRFAAELRRRFGEVRMSNYRGHGGGAFLNRGYSLDLFLSGRDERGFYRREDAIRLARAIAAAARAVNADWRIIYNDYSVAEEINREFRRTHMIFVGGVRRDRAKRVTGLNWHGPDPLILHFHLDLAPRGGAQLSEAEGRESDAPGTGPFESGSFETSEGHTCAACAARRETAYEAGWAAEQTHGDATYGHRLEEEQEGRFDEREHEPESEDFVSESPELASAGLSPAERKALEITSTLETGKRGGFCGLSGNFDGQGLSFGLVNWTIGTGSLQPLLRDFAREQPRRWAAIFGPDAERFLRLILPKGAAAAREQHRFAVEQMNAVQMAGGRKRWAIKEPWRGYFQRLSEDPAFRQIQLRYVRHLMARAAYFCRLFKLRSEQAFAFMFDAVSSHGKWWLTKKIGGVPKRRQLIEARLRPLQGALGSGLPEQQVLMVIADVLAETSSPRWAGKVRARKRWFVTGEHPRSRELAGLRPRPDLPWSSSAPPGVREDEDLAWLDLKAGETEWPQMEEEEEEEKDQEDFDSSEAEEGFNSSESEEGFGSFESEDFDSFEREEGFESFEGEGFNPSPTFLEALQEAARAYETSETAEAYAGFEDFESPGAECLPYTAEYRKLIRRKGTAEGQLVDRTTEDRRTTLSLQFSDYDVNAYLPDKPAHQQGITQLIGFIRSRIAAGTEVGVTFTGSASKTGTQSFNQELSEKRAHCLALVLRARLPAEVLAKCTFDPKGDGFSKAKCNGADCELPGYRSVLVSVHALNRPPPPVPPEPETWDKFEIRCCAFQSLSLGQVAMDEFLKRLPGGIPRTVAEKLAPILRQRLEKALRRLLQRLPKLGALGADISKLLKYLPIEVTRQKAVFQVRERGKPGARTITLCYDGWGGRLALPIPGKLEDAVDDLLKSTAGLSSEGLRAPIRKVLTAELERMMPRRATKLLAKIDSNVPGPWKPFDLNRRERLEVFRGPADIFVDVITNVGASGQIWLAFDGPKWNNLDRARRVAMKLKGGETSVIDVTVDGGVGFDLLSINKGNLVDHGCSCEPASLTELFGEPA